MRSISYWIKFEQSAVMVGLASVMLHLLALWNWSSLSDGIRSLFYGGQPAAVLIGMAIIAGIFGVLLFPLNLIFKRTENGRGRLVMIFLFLSSLPFLGLFQ